MAKVNTVLGSIDVGDTGITMMHEHVLVIDSIMTDLFPRWFDRQKFVDHACKIIAKAKSFGIKTFVDQSTIDMGRQIDIIKEISEKAEINIIVSTGIYNNHLNFLYDKDASFLAELLAEEFEKGIGRTGVKPALIKCASYASGVDGQNEKILRAVAMAHRATGAPIGTHSEKETGLVQQDIFESEGVPLNRVIIGHLGDLYDMDYIEKVGKRGSYLGMDRFGIDPIVPLNNRVEHVAELCRRGFTDRLVLGHDYLFWADFKDSIPMHGAAFQDVDWDFLLNHDVQLSYILEKAAPLLKNRGLSDEDIHAMVVDTPRNFFS